MAKTDPNLPFLFHTSYGEGARRHGTVIEADSIEHARALAVQRGLNETIDSLGYQGGDPGLGHFGAYLLNERYVDALHEATFLGFIAMQSGAATAREILGDRGLLHEIVHLMQMGNDLDDEHPDSRLIRIRERAKDIAMRVPGWPNAHINHFYRNAGFVPKKEVVEA
ncbi:hypothetical protein HOU02_gp414 [Caulobacter phage CcrBL9]|uniref:Uncharacterized protein n=1 Tax=Caulobacter phage CcrBL9 TaxID=2283270 RepID=A0A385EBP4_9CAUD|nr:hypothetical protein HOU02_gp414 [Caulobacter phage CcrBL9]AXQ69311.1 hypothetical protein CcrBL9_gp287 [Caulobacter phage CcrBL9]